MKQIIAILAALLWLQSINAQQWVQVWGDEFNTPALPELTVGTDHASHLLQVSIRTGSSEHVTLSVCNLFGSTMATLHAGELDPGTHQFQYQADGSLPGGLYLLRAQTPKGESFTKFILY